MDTLIYTLFTVAYIGLIIWLLQRSEPHFVWTNVLYLIILALIYDNGIIALGKVIGESDILYYLNYMRFVLHAFITPLLVVFSVAALREANIRWAKHRAVFLIATLYTIVLMVIEFMIGVWDLSLQPALEYGALRYESTAEHSGPPVMILLATVVMLICSLFLLLQRKWPWFFIGVVVMTIGSMVSFSVPSSAITNLFELFLMTMLVLTKKWLGRGKRFGFEGD